MAVGANETVVPASELQDAMRRIKQLESDATTDGAISDSGKKYIRTLDQ
jgi:hypothetical protein